MSVLARSVASAFGSQGGFGAKLTLARHLPAAVSQVFRHAAATFKGCSSASSAWPSVPTSSAFHQVGLKVQKQQAGYPVDWSTSSSFRRSFTTSAAAWADSLQQHGLPGKTLGRAASSTKRISDPHVPYSNLAPDVLAQLSPSSWYAMSKSADVERLLLPAHNSSSTSLAPSLDQWTLKHARRHMRRCGLSDDTIACIQGLWFKHWQHINFDKPQPDNMELFESLGWWFQCYLEVVKAYLHGMQDKLETAECNPRWVAKYIQLEPSGCMKTGQVRKKLRSNNLDGLAFDDIDHIIPKSRGGVNHPMNYLITPRSLNRRFGKSITPAKVVHVTLPVAIQVLAHHLPHAKLPPSAGAIALRAQ